MKIASMILLMFLTACIDKGADYYRKHYIKNKSSYYSIYQALIPLLNRDTVYKYRVEFTGKLLLEYPYIDDSTIFRFYGLGLKDEEKSKVSHLMYELGLQYAIIFKDSIQYCFSGYNRDIITVFRSPNSSTSGLKIDENAYLRIVNW